MTGDIQFLDLLTRLWPIYTAIIGAIAWLFYELNQKVSKNDCKSCRQDCIYRQSTDVARLEQNLDSLRKELREDIRNLTNILANFIEKNGGNSK